VYSAKDLEFKWPLITSNPPGRLIWAGIRFSQHHTAYEL